LGKNRGNCSSDSYAGLNFCAHCWASVVPCAAVEPLETRAILTVNVCACAFCLSMSVCTTAFPEHPRQAKSITEHAFAQQPPARLQATKHRGEMRCFAGPCALVDGKRQGVSSGTAFSTSQPEAWNQKRVSGNSTLGGRRSRRAAGPNSPQGRPSTFLPRHGRRRSS
jgi:hypothetical protein